MGCRGGCRTRREISPPNRYAPEQLLRRRASLPTISSYRGPGKAPSVCRSAWLTGWRSTWISSTGRNTTVREGVDINLVADPATGYPAAGLPADPRWGPVLWLESGGKADSLALASSLRRQFAYGFQGSLAYTLMFYAHDNHPVNRFGPSADNPLNLDDPLRVCPFTGIPAPYVAPQRALEPGVVSRSPAFITSGPATTLKRQWRGDPFGKSRVGIALTNRLDLGPTIAVGGTAGDRFEGPTRLENGDRVPRNGLKGLPIQKVDVRLAKVIRLHDIELEGIAEVYNLFNHRNFGAYNGVVTSPQFGAPLQNLGNTYRPRTGQLALRVTF